MKDNVPVSRRTFLTTGIAATTMLAGCSGNSNSQPGTSSPTSATPTLSEFSYPNGATKNGIDWETLFNTHESTVTEADSVTVQGDVTIDRGDQTTTQLTTVKFNAGDVWREMQKSFSNTEKSVTQWSPNSRDKLYSQISSEGKTAYRIGSDLPSQQEAMGLGLVKKTLKRFKWGEATEVVKLQNGTGVRYEATGKNEPLVTESSSNVEFTASVTVLESGFIGRLTDQVSFTDKNGTERKHELAATISAVGKTSIQKPSWASTAIESGFEFRTEPTDDQTAVKLTLANGSKLPTESSVALSTPQNRGSASFPEPVTAGDTLYLGLSETGELQIAENGPPENTIKLNSRTRVSVYHNDLTVLSRLIEL